MRLHATIRPAALAAALVLPLSAPISASAQERSDSARLTALERQLEALTRELERQQLGAEVVDADTTAIGLGPAASKVYRVGQGVSVGGYGEVVYHNYAAEREDDAPAGARDVIDALRGILYVGYKFNDKLLLNTEIEIEHVDEVFLEFAYLDYRFSDAIGARAGLLLAPLGLINELHEPPVFLGTSRPLTESVIIPTTWRENGIGLADPELARLTHQLEPVAILQEVVDQVDVVLVRSEGVQPLLVGRHPVEGDRRALDLADHGERHLEIPLIVVDQQDADRV